MTFNEIGSGGAIISGCSLISFVDILYTTFAQGDVGYNVNKARVGVLEKVVIKKQKAIRNLKTHGKLTVLYIDTFNALWNESDLVSLSNAKTIAVNYLQGLLEDLDKIKNC